MVRHTPTLSLAIITIAASLSACVEPEQPYGDEDVVTLEEERVEQEPHDEVEEMMMGEDREREDPPEEDGEVTRPVTEVDKGTPFEDREATIEIARFMPREIEDASFSAVVHQLDSSFEVPLANLSASIQLAVREDVDDSPLLTLDTIQDRECGVGLDGELEVKPTINQLSSTHESVEVVGRIGSTFELDPVRSGNALVSIRGALEVSFKDHHDEACRARYGEEAMIDFQLDLDVLSSELDGIRYDLSAACDGDEVLDVLPGTKFSDLLHMNAGNIFRCTTFAPLNVDFDSPAEITILSSIEGHESDAVSLAEWVVPDEEQNITIKDSMGGELKLRVLDPRRIDSLDVAFYLPGFAGSPVLLGDEETMGEGGWGRTADKLAATVTATRAGEHELCIATLPENLEFPTIAFSAREESVCEPILMTHDVGVLHYGVSGFRPQPESAWPPLSTNWLDLQEDGLCAADLTISAPWLMGGEPLVMPFAKNLVNTSSLLTVE